MAPKATQATDNIRRVNGVMESGSEIMALLTWLASGFLQEQ